MFRRHLRSERKGPEVAEGRRRRYVRVWIFPLIWIIIGIIVAVNHGYKLDTWLHGIDFASAVVLWPWVLGGVVFAIHF